MFHDTERTFTPAQIKKADALKRLTRKKLDTMEYRNVTLKKVSNLSHADVEEIHDAMSTLVSTHTDPYADRMDPTSDIKQVYHNAGVY